MRSPRLKKTVPLEAKQQRVDAKAIFKAKFLDGTHLADLYQCDAAKIKLPQKQHKDLLECVLINTAGGLTGGDKLSWDINLEKNSVVSATTQGFEKIYRSSGETCYLNLKLTLKENSTLFWMPHPTILYNGGHAKRKISVDLSKNAKLVFFEALCFGRDLSGETIDEASFEEDWCFTSNGNLIHLERSKISGPLSKRIQEPSIASGKKVIASFVILAGSTDSLKAQLEPYLPNNAQVSAGMSAISYKDHKKLIIRIIADDTYTLQKAVTPIVAQLYGKFPAPLGYKMETDR